MASGFDPEVIRRYVAGAKAGDQASFAALMDLATPQILMMLKQLGRDVISNAVRESDDLVSDVFMAAWLGIPQFEPRTENGFQRWIARLTRSIIVDNLRYDTAARRARDRASGFGGREPLDPSLAQSSVAKRREEVALLERCQGHKLTPLEQSIVRDLYVEGLSERATARRNGISRKTFHARWNAIARKLKRCVEGGLSS